LQAITHISFKSFHYKSFSVLYKTFLDNAHFNFAKCGYPGKSSSINSKDFCLFISRQKGNKTHFPTTSAAAVEQEEARAAGAVTGTGAWAEDADAEGGQKQGASLGGGGCAGRKSVASRRW